MRASFSSFIFRYKAATSPEDPRYRSSLSPPCPTLVVDNLSLDVSVEELTDIFAKVMVGIGALSPESTCKMFVFERVTEEKAEAQG